LAFLCGALQLPGLLPERYAWLSIPQIRNLLAAATTTTTRAAAAAQSDSEMLFRDDTTGLLRAVQVTTRRGARAP
jgi:hypothetical protein